MPGALLYHNSVRQICSGNPSVKCFKCQCYTFTGQIQEEEEKEAQETRQEKEKEGSISVRLGARLTTVGLRFSHPPDSSLVVQNFSHPAPVITLEQKT